MPLDHKSINIQNFNDTCIKNKVTQYCERDTEIVNQFMVKLSLSAETLKLDSNNLDFGHATQSISVTHYQGDDIDINFNIKYLIDFLKVVDSELIIFLIHLHLPIHQHWQKPIP
jgi:hypothetical protein